MSELVPFDFRDVEEIGASEPREIRWTSITGGVLVKVDRAIEKPWEYGNEFSPLYCVRINGRTYIVAKNKNGEKVLLLNGKPSYLHGIEDRHTNRRFDDTRTISHTDTEKLISEVGQSFLLHHMQQPNIYYSYVRPVKCIDDTLSFMLESSRQHHTIFGEVIVMWGKERVHSILGGSPSMQYQDPKNPVSVILQNGDTIPLHSDNPLSALSIARVCRH